MFKKMLLAGLIGFSVCAPMAHAEYITAHEEMYYEKFVIDTDSIFYPEANSRDMFNVLVWKYTDQEGKNQPAPYVYRFKCKGDTWYIFTKKNAKDDGSYKKIEKNSIAYKVLAKTLPYIR